MKGSILVEALESFWAKIQENKPEIQDAILTTGWSNNCHGWFCNNIWNHKGKLKNEIFINGEILSDPKKILDTFLHEATHALAVVRGIEDFPESNPKYHNKNFKKLAEQEFSLTVTRASSYGYCDSHAPFWLMDEYRSEIQSILDLELYRVTEDEEDDKPKPPRQVCACDKDPRYLRLSKKQKELGPIICGICQKPFEDEEED